MLFCEDVLMFLLRNTVIMELLTDNPNMCKHYQIAVLEHPPSPDVSIFSPALNPCVF